MNAEFNATKAFHGTPNAEGLNDTDLRLRNWYSREQFQYLIAPISQYLPYSRKLHITNNAFKNNYREYQIRV